MSMTSAHHPTPRRYTTEYTNKSGISDAPKYLDSAHAAMSTADATKALARCVRSPVSQNTTAHTQKQSIGTSTITVLAQTRYAGVSTAARQATSGLAHNRDASTYVP